MENIENKANDEKLVINNLEINDYLLETSKWGNFLAIVGYIGMGIMILMSFFIMFGFSKISEGLGNGFPMGIMGSVYILIAVLYYFPINYLHKFSKQIKQGLSSNDLSTVISGFGNLKSLFKFMGIFTIVILSIYGLVLLIALPTMLLLNN